MGSVLSFNELIHNNASKRCINFLDMYSYVAQNSSDEVFLIPFSQTPITKIRKGDILINKRPCLTSIWCLSGFDRHS
jgi:hypothetical protein